MAEGFQRGQERFGPRIIMKTVKEELFRWTCEKHATNSFLNRDLLREKALRLTKSYGLNGFKCSDGWLTHFLKEHGFSGNPVNEDGPVFDDYRDWIDTMRPIITKYRHSDLFHVDELTMYSDVLPRKMLSKEVDDSAGESPKNRITILMGCDSSGTTKLPLLICGSYPARATVKEHDYYHNETSYVEEDLFRNWLTNLNDRMARCNRKILLFLRRSRAYALKDFVPSNVRLVYIPEDFPPRLRPLRRDVFHYVKMVVRRRCAERLKGYTSEWNVRDVLSCVIEAWETIPRELVIFSFQRTRFRTDDCFLQIDCDCWDSLKLGVSFRRFVTFDDDLSDEQMPYDAYNLKVNCKDVIDIDEDSVQSVRVDAENIGSTGSRSLSDESGRDSTISLERKNRTDEKLNPVTAKTRSRKLNDKDRIAIRKRLKDTPLEGNGRRKISQKRTYSEAECSARGGSGYRRRSKDKIINDVSAPKIRTVRLSTSARSKVFKERTPRRTQPTANNRESLRTILHRAFALSSSRKAHRVRKLIDTVYPSNPENTRNPDRWSRSKQLAEQSDSDSSECTNKEEVQSKQADEAKGGTNKIDSSSPNSFLGKFNQPSTSANNRNSLSKEIGHGAAKETFERLHCTVASPTASELCEQNHVSSLNPTTNPNKESSSSPVRREVLQFSKKKRRRSRDASVSEDDSDSDESKGKKLKTDHDWFKQFETTFVFGSPNADCPTARQQDENIVESCIFNIRPGISPRD